MAAKIVGKWFKNSSKKIPEKEGKLFLALFSSDDGTFLITFKNKVWNFVDYWGHEPIPIENLEILYWAELEPPSKKELTF